MKNEEKNEVTITINGMDPEKWYEEKEGRVAVIFCSEPDGEHSNVLHGYILGNGGKFVSMMKHVFNDHPDFREIVEYVLSRRIAETIVDEMLKEARKRTEKVNSEEE
jgi:hypothetical protein